MKSLEENMNYWESVINEAKASKMKIQEYLENRNISKHKYYYWHKRIKDREKNITKKQNTKTPSEWIQLKAIAQYETKSNPVVLSINGFTIEASNIMLRSL